MSPAESPSPPPKAATAKPSVSRWVNVALCLGLALVTIAIYAPVRGFDFVNYDDQEYVTENPQVRVGLTVKGIAWAFTHSYSNNWHPLTWMSHMFDCQWWGLRAGFHHLHNVSLHAMNAVLLFLLLNSLTGARWRSVFVAALFAWHPLHVESVAWISERKDVLSAFWGLLSLLVYARFVVETNTRSERAWAFYSLSLACFILGLLSKPMLVTWPLVLLLLDAWPLQRFESTSRRRLGLEKLPFLVVAVASGVVTYVVQQASGAMRDFTVVPLPVRLANALKSYVVYLVNMVWPDQLAVFYPLRPVPLWLAVACAVVLIAISWLVWTSRRSRPWLAFGWCWYLVTLTPVIGLVQVGDQARADRYTYLPLIGIFIAVTWSLAEFAQHARLRRVATVVAVTVLSACLVRTANQLPHWTGSIALFEQVLAFSPDAYLAHNNLGIAYSKAGRYDEAIAHFQKALQLKPDFVDPYNNLGLAFQKTGREDEAMRQFQQAQQLNPGNAEVHYNFGNALLRRGQLEEAIRHYELALTNQPDHAQARNNLAFALAQSGRLTEAVSQFEQALALKPDYADAHVNLGSVLFRQGEVDAAIQHYRMALQWQPDLPQVRMNLALALERKGAWNQALEQYEALLALQPDDADGHNKYAEALLQSGRAAEALSHWETATQLAPSNSVVLNNLARLLLIHPDAARRDPARALQLTTRACELTHDQDVGVLLTRASALGAANRAEDALKTARLALGLAQSRGRLNQVEEAQQQIKSWEDKLRER